MRADRSSMSEGEDDDESRKRAASVADPLGSSSRSWQRSSHSGWGCGAATSAAAPVVSAPPPDQVLENVLENVLHFLTCRRDRNAASLVCRSWYRAESQTRTELFIGNCYAVSPRRAIERFPNARSVALKGRPRFADFNLVPEGWGGYFGAWAAAMSPAYTGLEKIHLKRMTIADDDLILVARSFPCFKELVITCCDGFSTYGIAAIAHYCRQLRVLDLIEAEVEDDGTDWIPKFPEKATCLESLIFDCVDCQVDFDDLEALVARSPSLKRLRVNYSINIRQLSRLMARAPQLTDLGTGSFRPSTLEQMGDDEDVEQMAEISAAFATSKSIVGLSGFRSITSDYLPAIYPVCANLVSLNFSFADINLERFMPVISRCYNLRTLWVLDSVRDEGLQAVAATCSNLRELRVFPAEPTEDTESPVSDVGLTAISEGCRKLRSILYFCQYMTNASVIAMSKNCSELVVFRLCIMGRHKPDHITGQPMDEGFGAIVMNCKKLTRLAVSGLLTDKAFAYIGKYGKLVRTLSVAFAGDSDHGLRYVLEGCPKLQKLEIRDSPFGDQGLLSGLHQYYNMRFLWMSSCKLTLKGCKDVARRLPNLVVELIRDPASYSEKKTKVEEQEDSEQIGAMYLYRSLSGPRVDAPPFVQIL